MKIKVQGLRFGVAGTQEKSEEIAKEIAKGVFSPFLQEKNLIVVLTDDRAWVEKDRKRITCHHYGDYPSISDITNALCGILADIRGEGQ